MTTTHRYTEADVAAVYRVIRERRDMRHFRPDPIEPALLARLLRAAHLAPSVGYMQPWRFIRITDAALRARIHALVEEERLSTARALGQREDEFLRLKVEGILDCGEVLVAALMDKREPHIFGRRTLPEMDLASVACAIQNLWLAARAEGIGVGWVSMFDPQQLGQLLHLPPAPARWPCCAWAMSMRSTTGRCWSRSTGPAASRWNRCCSRTAGRLTDPPGWTADPPVRRGIAARSTAAAAGCATGDAPCTNPARLRRCMRPLRQAA